MSVIAIHPRIHPPAVPTRAGSPRRRPASAGDAPVLRVTVDVPLVGDRLSPELSRLLELVRDLVDRGESVALVTGVTGSAEPAPTKPEGARPDWPGGTESATDTVPVDETGTAPADESSAGSVGPGPVGSPGGRLAGAGTDDVGTLRVLTGPRVVLRGGVPVPLTRLEFDLLVFLVRNPRRVFTRRQLLKNVWGHQHAVERTVDVHVRRLRAKAGDGMALVTTVHGVGYRLADDALVRVYDGIIAGGFAVPSR